MPGFAEDGLAIIDPVAVIETVIKTQLKRTTGILRSRKLAPTYEVSKYPTTYTNMLVNDYAKNIKTYLEIPDAKPFVRISTSARKNGCWFDSFLSCMSPTYRSISLDNRDIVASSFRNWCRVKQDKLIEQIPEFIKPFFNVDDFKMNLDAMNKEIDAMTGFMIAWYFGVNIVYIVLDKNGFKIDKNAYQSHDCKTIFILNIIDSNHYEPLGILGLTTDNKYNEETSTFLFEWTDQRLCKLPGRPITWTHPVCPAEVVSNADPIDSENSNALVGGRRRNRKTRRRQNKKKRATYKRSR